jgi:O-methyltransferase
MKTFKALHAGDDSRFAIDNVLATSRWGFLARRWVSAFELRVLKYYKRNPGEKVGLELLKDLYAAEASSLSILFRGATPVLFSPGELLNLWQQARLLKDHGGAFAEVGAFQGTSAELVCKTKGDRQFYVFEAFAGLPCPTREIDDRFHEGLFRSGEQQLRRRLQRYPNTTIIAGYFPNTADLILTERFSYVHIDLDLYEPTCDALNFFYPRLLAGGRIITHDYSQSEGVWRAVDDFLSDKDESVETVGATQAMITKLR